MYIKRNIRDSFIIKQLINHLYTIINTYIISWSHKRVVVGELWSCENNDFLLHTLDARISLERLSTIIILIEYAYWIFILTEIINFELITKNTGVNFADFKTLVLDTFYGLFQGYP